MNPIFYAVAAYTMWGLLPLYWKTLQAVPALQIICHRIIWSLVFLLLILLVMRKLTSLRQNREVMRSFFLAALLLSANWLIYIWAVNAGFIVETSLGYFINPLLSVLLGVIVLRERLRTGQWIAISIAALGVLYLTIMHGQIPWIALALASTFGFYGLIKKTAPLPAMQGLTLETGLLLLPAIAYLLYTEWQGTGSFLHVSWAENLLLIGAGITTTAPLLLFAMAAQQVPLSVVGMLQYIAPILQLLIGLVIYDEPFVLHQAIGYGLVWVALVIFIIDGLRAHRNKRCLIR